jgi:type I restriction enzyme S subunit
MENVSKRWRSRQLSDICFISSGYAFKSNYFKNTGIPVIRISDIQQERVSSVNSVRVNAKLNDFEEKFLVHKGDILIAMSGATTGKMGIYTDDEVVLLNQRVGNFLFYCDDNNLKKYVYYYLNLIAKDILKRAGGAAQPNIGKSQLENIKINLPPLIEQKRIVAKIESLFSRLDSAKDSLERVRQEIKRYRQSVLKAVFEGKLTNVILQNKELGSLVKINSRNDLNDNINVGFLPMKLIEANFSGEHSFEVRKWGKVKAGFTHIKNGDVLLAKITPCFENGKSALVNGLPNGYGAATTEVFALTVNQAVLLSKYLYLFLRQEMIILEGKKLMTGAVGQKRVPRNYLESLLLPVCSLDEQREIIRNIDSRFERAKVLEDVVEQGLDKIEQLKKSILKQAFEGKLVEPDPNDEPVEVLLERIKTQKKTLLGNY